MAAFIAAPAAAREPNRHFIPFCTGEGARLLPIDDDNDAPAPDRKDGNHGLCAHMTCPRETRTGGRDRDRS